MEQGSLSAKTVNDILAVIGLALAYGEETYSIPKSKIFHVKEPIQEMRALSVDEQKQLGQYLNTDMSLYKFSVLLALYTGIRVGELCCALQWEDISEESIVISKTLLRIKDGDKTTVETTDLKTNTSNRIIPTEIAEQLGYKSHSAVSKRLAKMKDQFDEMMRQIKQ